MEKRIIKHGDTARKFVCPACFCEFIAPLAAGLEQGGTSMTCPECKCRVKVDTGEYLDDKEKWVV